MTDRGLNDEFDDLHRAVREFGRVEIEALSRRVIYRLQRITASGIFGDGYIYKSVWDEFCHEVQEGPHTMLEDAWDSLVESHIADAVKRVAIESAVLLTIYAVYQLDEDEAAIPLGTVGLRESPEWSRAPLARRRVIVLSNTWDRCEITVRRRTRERAFLGASLRTYCVQKKLATGKKA